MTVIHLVGSTTEMDFICCSIKNLSGVCLFLYHTIFYVERYLSFLNPMLGCVFKVKTEKT